MRIVSVILFLFIVGCGGGGSSSDSREPPTPQISSIRTGDGFLSISFSIAATPSNAPLSAVSLITASCSSSSQDQKTVTGAASPLEIKGLGNGREYTCTVTAKAVSGVTRTSPAVKATPNPTYSLTVIPAINGTVSSGVLVDVYSVTSGIRLATGTTDSTGRVTLQFGAPSSELVVVTSTGSPTARFYSYNTDTTEAFPASKSFYSIVNLANVVAPQTPVTVNPITSAIALAAGVDAQKIQLRQPLGITAESLRSATNRILIALGIDPTTYSAFTVPALPGIADLARRVFLAGSNAELLYGLALISLSSLKLPNEDILGFFETVIRALVNGNFANVFPSASVTLPESFMRAKSTLLIPDRQPSFTQSIAPGAARFDYAIFDRERFE
jgi:hypothetical protein